MVAKNLKYPQMDRPKNLFSEYRKDKGLRQKDVAKYLNVATATYANWEQGRAEPDLETLKRLSELYQATINQLLGLKDKDLILTSRIQYERIVQARDILDKVVYEMHINSGLEIVGDNNRIEIKKRIKK